MKIDGSNYAFIDADGNVAGEAILFMKSRVPNPDGTIGFMVQPDTPEWLAWDGYFSQYDHAEDGEVKLRFPKQLAGLRFAGSQGKPYMVPARMPQIFDKTFSASSPRLKKVEKKASEMTLAERMDVLDRLGRANPLFARFKVIEGNKEAAE